MKLKKKDDMVIEAFQFTRNLNDIDRIKQHPKVKNCIVKIPRTPFAKGTMAIEVEGCNPIFIDEDDWFIVKEDGYCYGLSNNVVKRDYEVIKEDI